MSRLASILRAVGTELFGLFVDDALLPLGLGAVLVLAWIAEGRAGAAAAFAAAVAAAAWIAAVSVLQGRARRRAESAAVHSEPGGRVRDRDQPDPQTARQAEG